MNYYQVDVSSEPKIIGVTNGVHQIEIEKKEMQKKDAFNEFLTFFNTQNKGFWNNQDKIKDIKVPIIKAKLLKKAKLTDIMGYTENVSFLNNVFSEKYISILKDFEIGHYTTFEVAIQEVIEKYYMLFIETIRLDQINFEKSVIFKGLSPKVGDDNIIIKNFEEYNDFTKTSPIHNFEKISISKEHLGKDIIKIQATSKLFYSEKLINFLLDSGITGLQVNYSNSIRLEFS